MPRIDRVPALPPRKIVHRGKYLMDVKRNTDSRITPIAVPMMPVRPADKEPRQDRTLRSGHGAQIPMSRPLFFDHA